MASTDFERERDRLIAEIAENLAKAVTNVNQLNRNIENVHIVGAGLEPVNKLWKQFETVMKKGDTIQTEGTNPIRLQPLNPAGTDETAVLPAGVAPGGGQPAALATASHVAAEA